MVQEEIKISVHVHFNKGQMQFCGSVLSFKSWWQHGSCDNLYLLHQLMDGSAFVPLTLVCRG